MRFGETRVAKTNLSADPTGQVKRPRMRLPEQRVQQLIDAAIEEFQHKGYRRGSIENISRVTASVRRPFIAISTTRAGFSRRRSRRKSSGLKPHPTIFRATATHRQKRLVALLCGRSTFSAENAA